MSLSYSQFPVLVRGGQLGQASPRARRHQVQRLERVHRVDVGCRVVQRHRQQDGRDDAAQPQAAVRKGVPGVEAGGGEPEEGVQGEEAADGAQAPPGDAQDVALEGIGQHGHVQLGAMPVEPGVDGFKSVGIRRSTIDKLQ